MQRLNIAKMLILSLFFLNIYPQLSFEFYEDDQKPVFFFLSKLNKQVFISQILSDCLIFTSRVPIWFVSIGFWLWLLDHNSNSVTHATWFLRFSTVTLSNWLWLVLNSGLTSKPKSLPNRNQSQKDCWSVVA